MTSNASKERILEGEVAVVTGASRGIGLEIARALARAGAAVLLTARSAELIERGASEIVAAGGKAEAFVCDLAGEDAPARIVARAREALGKLTILVNNAGLGIYGPLENATPDAWEVMFRVNARAPLFLALAALPSMREAGGGTIVNISSVVGVKGYPNQGIYGATKHAMMGWSKTLAVELKNDKIRVHTICPGGVDTELVRAARPDLDPAGLIRAKEIAETVLFLLSMRGRAVIDDIHIRRAAGDPWF